MVLVGLGAQFLKGMAAGKGNGGYTKFQQQKQTKLWLGGGFKYFLFSPLVGEDFQFD